MNSRIRRIQLGVTSTYLITGEEGYILVDAGEPGLTAKFKRIIGRWGIKPNTIRLLVITHAHYDHVGSLAEIKQWCDCPVLIHPYEEEILRQARIVIPPGTKVAGKVMSKVGSLLRPFMKFPACHGDLLVTERYSLHSFGLDGIVLPTPGHTQGSLSVVLASGEAMVGDLAMNFLGQDTFPIFGDDRQQIKQSGDLVKGEGVRIVYPAHGGAFPISRLGGTIS
ncbi:MAG: MBL fold metallo-hydrolase [Methanomassiliicoccales archaeon]